MQPQVLIIGCGDLGSAVAAQLVRSGIKATGVKRSPANISNINIIQADVTQPATLNQLTGLKPQILIYCVAAGGQSDAEYKMAYVDGLKNVLDVQTSNTNLKHVFFVSSTRVYGQKTDQLLDENVAAKPADFGGERLLQAEQLLTLAANAGFDSTVLRLSGIYGPGRLRMIRLAVAGQWPEYDSWSNRIHRDDAAAFITFLIEKALSNESIKNTYIVTDSKPVSQYEVLAWIAQQLKAPLPENLQAGKAKSSLGGKRLSNAAMVASGFVMQYPDYQAGYGALIAALEAAKGHA